MEVGGQRHAPAALPPGKTQYPLYRRLSGPQNRSGRVRNISSPTGIRSPDRPASSKSLYRLSYPGPHVTRNTFQLSVISIPTQQQNKISKLKYCCCNVCLVLRHHTVSTMSRKKSASPNKPLCVMEVTMTND